MNEYRRYDGESDDQLIIRVTGDKDKIGSWKDVANILNDLLGHDWDESAYRKQRQAYDKFNAATQEDKAKMLDVIEDLRRAKHELEKERKKIQTANVEYNRRLRQESRFEMLYENIRAEIKQIEPPALSVYSNRHEDGENEYVLLLGDIHYGSDFRSANNTYSREICKERFEELLSQVDNYVAGRGIAKIKVLNVGDTIQGLLRMSDLQVNDTTVVQCVVEISHIIADFLNKLSEYCEVDYYHITAANHSQTRPLGSKASELAGEDMEKIIANYIKDILAHNTRVHTHFDLDNEQLEFKIFDFDCIAEHGHRVKSIQNYLRDKSLLMRKTYDYGFLGHTHASQCISAGEGKYHNAQVIVAPSLRGSDPYSDTLNVGNKASADLLRFNRRYGHVGTDVFILN